MKSTSGVWVYMVMMIIIWLVYLRLKGRFEKKSRELLKTAQALKLTEPASLHPVFNDSICIGCGACYRACPEGDVIGIINKKGRLVNPSHCIGHGACQKACPMDAITLVFGSAERGVDIPEVSAEFETNVKGIFIAGELGGMGLIKNAIEQGKQAMQNIANSIEGRMPDALDVIIVGAGPAGLSAALKAKQLELNYLVIEQDALGGTISHYPKGKCVMTSPAELPLAGKLGFKETTKENLMQFWQKISSEYQVEIRYGECVQSVVKESSAFVMKTNQSEFKAQFVLLALGRRGTPRKLGVPGEELSKVIYSLTDPSEHINKHVLVVGGGDSALEAAVSISEEKNTTVSLSYRGDGFMRAKPKNRDKVSEAQQKNAINVLLKSNVDSIEQTHVNLRSGDEIIKLKNDIVIVNAGGILPTAMLKSMGISIDTKFGTA